ncbi:MAG: hypothetical protein U0797_31825 [Gemmataceae bacterium]
MSLPSLPTSRRHVLTTLAGAAALLAMAGPARGHADHRRAQDRLHLRRDRPGRRLERGDRRRPRPVEQIPGVTVAVTENVPEEATALRNAIDLYVKRGFNIIVGTTYGYSDGILEAAKQYPNVAFVNASGATNAANLEGFYARTYEELVPRRDGREQG